MSSACGHVMQLRDVPSHSVDAPSLSGGGGGGGRLFAAVPGASGGSGGGDAGGSGGKFGTGGAVGDTPGGSVTALLDTQFDSHSDVTSKKRMLEFAASHDRMAIRRAPLRIAQLRNGFVLGWATLKKPKKPSWNP